MDNKQPAFDVEQSETIPAVAALQSGEGEPPNQWRIEWSDTGVVRETSMAWVALFARDDEAAEVTEL